MTVSDGTVLQGVAYMTLPGGHIAQNVFYWQLIGGTDATDANCITAITSKINAFFTDLAAQIKSTVILGTVTIHEWDWDGVSAWETGRLLGEAALTDSFAGTYDLLPFQSAAIITAFTSDVRRRSRKSIAGFTEFEQVDSDLTAAAETALGNAAVEWLSNAIIMGAQQLAPVLAGSDGLVYPLLTALISSVPGSQRQRKPGVGV